MITLFNEILYRPLLNIAVFIYNFLPNHDFGLAIIVLTVLVRVILMPLSVKAIKSQKALNAVNPKINEIKEKYKNDPNAQSQAIMKLYRENKINPLTGCLPLLIQLPIIIALYKVFSVGINAQSLNLVYGFIHHPEMVQKLFLGLVDITKRSIPLTLVAGGLQFIQSKQQAAFMKGQDGGINKQVSALNSQMLYFFPLFIIIIGWRLPAGLILYWITTTAFSIFEQLYIKYRYR